MSSEKKRSIELLHFFQQLEKLEGFKLNSGLSANSRLRGFSPEFAAACGFDLPTVPNAPSIRWVLKSTSLLISSGNSSPLRRRIARLQSKATGLVGKKPHSEAKATLNCFQNGTGSSSAERENWGVRG